MNDDTITTLLAALRTAIAAHDVATAAYCEHLAFLPLAQSMERLMAAEEAVGEAVFGKGHPWLETTEWIMGAVRALDATCEHDDFYAQDRKRGIETMDLLRSYLEREHIITAMLECEKEGLKI
jgi:hypothetical protein